MADHVWQMVPAPDQSPDGYLPFWNEVALFFNLPPDQRPLDYRAITVDDAREWLDEGRNPANPPISIFMANYWGTLSYGRFAFGINTPRDAAGAPIVPTVALPAGGITDLRGFITECINANAEAVWIAAGRLMDGELRLVPSVVLVKSWGTGAWAATGWTQTVEGYRYEILRITQLSFDLSFITEARCIPDNTGRGFWSTLCHENGHNFLDFGDLYGPQGCTGYWDLLGDNLLPGRMSEVSCVQKQRIGWIDYQQVILGPHVETVSISLAPYTDTGDAIKIVPDPVHNPTEYFVLEYRGSVGDALWLPDGSLPEQGLLITHIAERLGIPPTWLSREAPYFDPEFADFSDNGAALWTGQCQVTGSLYPQPGSDSFTPDTRPSSNLYGIPSGLSITNIRLEDGLVRCEVAIDGSFIVGWTDGARDTGVAGYITSDARTMGQDLFLYNDADVALAQHRQGQWHVLHRETVGTGAWPLGPESQAAIGDLDGDGRDEIVLLSATTLAVVEWADGGFQIAASATGGVDDWTFSSADQAVVADFDGDGRAEIFIRSGDSVGLIALADGSLRVRATAHDYVGAWYFNPEESMVSGRFTQPAREQIFIFHPNHIGLIDAGSGAVPFHLLWKQEVRLGPWTFGPGDKYTVGDFDGDGLDELYVRSAGRAAMFKWDAGALTLRWIADHIEPLAAGGQAVPLTVTDRSYAGRFLPDRDGILHRRSDGVAILTWENDHEFQARQRLDSPFNGYWRLADTDTFVLGDFQRVGSDIGDPTLDFITDHLTDVFMHNAGATGMFGVNHLPDGSDQIGMTWLNPREIVMLGMPERPHLPSYRLGQKVWGLLDGVTYFLGPHGIGHVNPLGPDGPHARAAYAQILIGLQLLADDVNLAPGQSSFRGLAHDNIMSGMEQLRTLGRHSTRLASIQAEI